MSSTIACAPGQPATAAPRRTRRRAVLCTRGFVFCHCSSVTQPGDRIQSPLPCRCRPGSLLAGLEKLNRDTDRNWSRYASHRERVTELTLAALSGHANGRVCILGAGNCNDLSLAEVSTRAAEIHLVDADGGALERGVARALRRRPLRTSGTTRLVLHAGIDLSGLPPGVMDEQRFSLSAVVKEALAGPRLAIGQPFDVVISVGLLTQLISLPVDALGAGHPELTPVVLAVRTGHMRLLVHLLRPGGHAVLITDVVSSDTTPGLAGAPDEALPRLLSGALAQRNFFTGVNPVKLRDELRTDPQLATTTTDSSLSGPWRWFIGPTRAYLVIGLTFRRTG